MKIDNRPSGWNTPRNVTRTDAAQTGKFQQTLATCTSLREPEDTITISYRAPAVEEAPVSVAASGAVSVSNAAAEAVRNTASRTGGAEILPGDSTEVKLAKLRQMAEEADYTGMSYDDIRTSIWNRYNDAFDGNMAAITTFPITHEWIDVNNQYSAEYCLNVLYPLQEEFRLSTGINVSTWSKDNYAQHERDMDAFHEYVRSKYGDTAGRELGYVDMSVKEREQAICQKYAGKNTLRDFLNMQGELYQSGVLSNKLGRDGAWAYIKAINYQLPATFFPDIYYDFSNDLPMNIPQSRWDAVLDGKFDARAFAADMRETLKTMNFSGWDFDIEGAISKGIDYLLEAVAKAQQAEQQRHAEWEKRAERAELAERAE
ncbi:MAG: hypothetical protein HDT37_08265 [Clostridiales bacterium]|nr:hypothetical protein [Clostridiales bacterium]